MFISNNWLIETICESFIFLLIFTKVNKEVFKMIKKYIIKTIFVVFLLIHLLKLIVNNGKMWMDKSRRWKNTNLKNEFESKNVYYI